ncbi:hypothetical protein DRN69_03900 [Candidatus Pacearchaeota archaeon]|nr:MAG: hypothetical protein DRN69_03900 [Candidatus Pacearchaeota archaeon]
MDRLAEEMRKMIKALREKGVPEKEIYELLDAISDAVIKSLEEWKKGLKKITKEELEKLTGKRKLEEIA